MPRIKQIWAPGWIKCPVYPTLYCQSEMSCVECDVYKNREKEDMK